MNIKEQIEREAERRYKPIDGSPNDAVTRAIREVFTQGANFALEMDRWIGVEEGLPDNRQTVLATDGSTQIVLEYKHGCWFVGLDQIHFVTHWQPLPKLPQ